MTRKKFNNGEDFEALATYLYALLSAREEYTEIEGPRVIMESPDGPREFDLVIHSRMAGIPVFTVVECRDLSRPLDIRHIDGFKSKIDDVNANKGVIISRNGFSKKALSKANRLGILTYTFDTVYERPDLAACCGSLPVFYAEIDGLEFNSRFATTINVCGPLDMKNLIAVREQMKTPEGQSEIWRVSFEAFYNGILPDFLAILYSAMLTAEIKITISDEWKRLELTVPNPNPGMLLLEKYPGIGISVSEPHLTYRFKETSCYFGDPFAQEGHMALVENVDSETLSFIGSVFDPRVKKKPIKEVLSKIECEPRTLESRSYIRQIKTDPNKWHKTKFQHEDEWDH